MDKNFGLSVKTFENLVEQLKNGDDELFERIFLLHFEDCLLFLKGHCSASHADAYDATMDALLAFHERLKLGKIQYGNLRFLFTRMARQIYFKKKKKEDLVEPVADFDAGDILEKVDPDDIAALNKAWKGLPVDCQALLTGFYYEGISLNEIAVKMGKTPAAVRKQKQRCVEKLKTLFLKFI